MTYLNEIERCVSWLAAWTIHHANHIRQGGEVKVGGHQASSTSLSTIMTALYYSVLRPQDRVAVKPHASPIFHAIQYLAGNQTREKLENFRGFKGAQSFPSRTKDVDDVDFSTGSVVLGVAQTLFSSLVQDYASAHGWMKDRSEGRMVSLIGDAEMDEGNIYEALIEGWKHGPGVVVFVAGERQTVSLDGVADEADRTTFALTGQPSFRQAGARSRQLARRLKRTASVVSRQISYGAIPAIAFRNASISSSVL